MSIKKLLGIEHDHITDEEIFEKMKEAIPECLKAKLSYHIITIDDEISKTSEIDIKNIPNLKPPSTKSHYDGALAGSLKIELASKTGSVETMSPTFDHGNPPKEISELVNKLLRVQPKVV